MTKHILRLLDPDANPGSGGNSGDDQVVMPKAAFAERLARAEAKAAKDLEARLVAEGRLLSPEEAEAAKAAREQAEQAEREKGQFKTSYEKAQQRLAELEQKLTTQAIDHSVTTILAGSPLRKDLDLGDVKAMLLGSGKLKAVDGRVVAADDLGGEIAAQDYIKAWLAQRPWALAPSQPSGTGSQPAGSSVPGLPSNWQNEDTYKTLTPEQRQAALADLRKSGAQAAFSGFQRKTPAATKKD